MKNHTKPSIFSKIILLIVTIIVPTIFLSSCGNSNDVVDETTLPTVVHPKLWQITTKNGTKIFRNVLAVHIPKENQSEAYQIITQKRWKVISKKL